MVIEPTLVKDPTSPLHTLEAPSDLPGLSV